MFMHQQKMFGSDFFLAWILSPAQWNFWIKCKLRKMGLQSIAELCWPTFFQKNLSPFACVSNAARWETFMPQERAMAHFLSKGGKCC